MEKNVIDRRALCEILADKLEMMILNENDLLMQNFPSEQNLAESFGVSRPVVREAILILKERGLVSSRQGAATIVSDSGAIEQFSRATQRIARMKNVTFEQLFQIRASLETLAIRLAAAEHNEADLTALRSLNLAMIHCSSQKKKRASLDIEFHLEIARMSNNPLLLTMERPLFELLRPIIEETVSVGTETSGVVWHDKLISAIAAHDEDAAADMMRAHLAISRSASELLAQKNGALSE